jgi:hypothetical protein
LPQNISQFTDAMTRATLLDTGYRQRRRLALMTPP